MFYTDGPSNSDENQEPSMIRRADGLVRAVQSGDIEMFDKPQVHFWKVGTGDSTSIVIKKNVVLQVDLNDNANDKNDNVPIVERLVEELPTIAGKPYLSCLLYTSPSPRDS